MSIKDFTSAPNAVLSLVNARLSNRYLIVMAFKCVVAADEKLVVLKTSVNELTTNSRASCSGHVPRSHAHLYNLNSFVMLAAEP